MPNSSLSWKKALANCLWLWPHTGFHSIIDTHCSEWVPLWDWENEEESDLWVYWIIFTETKQWDSTQALDRDITTPSRELVLKFSLKTTITSLPVCVYCDTRNGRELLLPSFQDVLESSKGKACWPSTRVLNWVLWKAEDTALRERRITWSWEL